MGVPRNEPDVLISGLVGQRRYVLFGFQPLLIVTIWPRYYDGISHATGAL
jgi:hypothetical protein